MDILRSRHGNTSASLHVGCHYFGNQTLAFITSIFLGLALTCWSSSLAQESSKSFEEQATIALAQPANSGIGTIPYSLLGDCETNLSGQACLNMVSAFLGTGAVKRLLDKGNEINHVDELGRTALHYASLFNGSEVVNYLVENGSDIEVHDAGGDTPLHIASYVGNSETAIALIEHDANIEARDSKKITPLHFAANADSFDIVFALVGKGANIEARTEDDETPLHLAAQANSVGAIMALIDYGANVDAYSNENLKGTPLLHAAFNGNVEAMEALLDNGANANVITDIWFTPLYWAALRNRRGAVELLVDRGADTDQIVFPAVSSGGKDVLQALVEKGVVDEVEANSRHVDYGYMPLHIASLSSMGDPGDTVQMLIDIGADTEARIVEGYETHYLNPVYKDQINGRVIMGLNPWDVFLFDGYRHPTAYGFTPLHYAAANQNAEPLRVLIDNGVDVNATAKFSGTPLHIAVAFGKVENVRELLNAGASLSAADSFGNQPIHLAAREKGAEVMRVLLETGADIEAKAANGYTALQYAAWRGDPDVFAALLEAGASTEVVTEDGQTIMDLANGNERLRGSPAELVPKSLMEHVSDSFRRLVQVF